LLNLNLYGYLNSIKIVFFELINFNKFKSLRYIENKDQEYKDKFYKKKYNSPYSPTPYYFLYTIKKNLFFLNKNFIFIDFGCGAGRVMDYFDQNFNKLIGYELDPYFKNFFKNKKHKLILQNLQKKNKLNLNKKKNYVFYFYQPFDKYLIDKIIKVNSHKTNKLYIILVNLDKKIKLKNFDLIYSKKFPSPKKNIYIFKKI
tara:strand:- start:1427 stop:2029 length:603 start_codon:yes stop_codon:yes gene_type:complete